MTIHKKKCVCGVCGHMMNVENVYRKGRRDAERDFQNSDYWNNYLAKVIKDARADAIDEFIDKFIKRNQFKQMNKCECINAMYVLAEQLKGQKK